LAESPPPPLSLSRVTLVLMKVIKCRWALYMARWVERNADAKLWCGAPGKVFGTLKRGKNCGKIHVCVCVDLWWDSVLLNVVLTLYIIYSVFKILPLSQVCPCLSQKSSFLVLLHVAVSRYLLRFACNIAKPFFAFLILILCDRDVGWFCVMKFAILILRGSGIALGYGLDDQGFESRSGWKFFSSSPRPERLWGPPNLLFNG